MLKTLLLISLSCLGLVFLPQNMALAQTKVWSSSSGAKGTKLEKVFSSVQLREDLAYVKNVIAAVHPELGYTSDLKQLARTYQELDVAFEKPMSKDAAWGEFARLNPYFADGHLMMVFSSARLEAENHLASGQGFFPFELLVDAQENLLIRASLDGSHCDFKGGRIEMINGIPAATIARELLKRMGGITPHFRKIYCLGVFGCPT